MNLAAIAIGWCLLGQASEVPDRYRPRVEPRGAPPARIEEAGRDNRREPSADAALGDAPQAAGDDLRVPVHPRDEPAAGATQGGGSRQKLRPPEILAQALARHAEAALVGKPITLLTAISRTTDRQQQLKIARADWRLCTAQADYHWALDQREKLKQYTHSHTNAPETLSARASARADVLDAESIAAQAQQELADLMGTSGEDLPLAADRPHVGGYNTYYEEIFNNRVPPARIRLIHRMLPIRRKAIDAHGEAILAALDAIEATGDEFSRGNQSLVAMLTALDQLKHERRIFMSAVRDYNQDIAEYLFAVAPPGTSDKTLVSKLILTSERAPQSPRTRLDDRATEPVEAEAPRDNPPIGDGQEAAPRGRTSEYRPDGAPESASDAPLFQGLMELTPEARVEKLIGLLHWDRALPPDAGQPVAFADFLRGVPPPQRLAAITAYWEAREQAARYQVLSELSQQLAALSAMAVGRHDEQGMAEVGVRMQAMRRAAQAGMLDAQGELLSAQFELTQLAGRRLDDEWLLPQTPPQWQHRKPADGGNGHAAPRGAEIAALRHNQLEELADAVIEADAGRATLSREAHQPSAHSTEPFSPDLLLWSVVSQSEDTLAFLTGLTDYNVAVAELELAALPANVPSEELAKILVVAGATNGKL